MKRFVLTLLLAAGAALTRPAAAQVYGQFGAAQPLEVDHRLAGAYLQFDQSSISLLGQLRLSFYPGVDFGFQGGLSRIDVGSTSRTSVRVGGDFKVQVAKPGEARPLALALGGALGIETADTFTLLSVGPMLLASWALPSGDRFVPYGGLTLLFNRLDSGSKSTTDLTIPVRLGLLFRASPDLHLVGELQLNVSDEVRDDVSASVGANFPF